MDVNVLRGGGNKRREKVSHRPGRREPARASAE